MAGSSEISLASATYLEIALEALRDANFPRIISALASIDAQSWEGIAARFPDLSSRLALYCARQAERP